MSSDNIQQESQLQSESQPNSIKDQENQQQIVSDQQPESLNVASIADGGRELSKTILYVGNIHRSVSDEVLQELFTSLGNPIKSLKVLQDKNKPGFNYAFVEYENEEFADNALNSLDNTSIADNLLKITKAYQTQQVKNSDTFNLFIGDLSLEVNDELLNSAFNKFPSLVQANVMWDMKSGRSRGYGFVCFNDKNDADEALRSMNGYLLGDRQIRLNWASHRDRRNTNHNHNHYNHNYNHNNYSNNNMNHMNNQNYNYNYNNMNNNNNNNHMNNFNNFNNNNANNMNFNNFNNMNNMMNVMNPSSVPNTNTNSDNSSNSSNLINSGINANSDAASMNIMNMNMINNPNFNSSNPNSSSVSTPNGNMLLSNSENSNANLNMMNNNNNHNNTGNRQQQQQQQQQPPPMMGPPSYEMVLRQAPNWLSAVYLGNLADFTTQNDLIPLLQNFGYIVNFKLLPERGCAFVTYDTHERAALAIVQLSGFTINGRPLKCGWGKSNKIVGTVRNIPPGIRN